MLSETIKTDDSTFWGGYLGKVLQAGGAAFTAYYTPNSSSYDKMCRACHTTPIPGLPGCVSAGGGHGDAPNQIVVARSHHPRGVQVSLCDASTRFVADSIDTGTWRALSTSRGEEAVGAY